MALPKIATKTYQTTLPHSKQEIEYRPYLVKEERALLMANQSEDENEMVNAVINLVDACIITDNILIKTMANVDLEWAFLLIRSKSVGEEVRFQQKCSECDKEIDVLFDLQNVSVVTGETHSLEYKLEDHNIGIRFTLPTSKTFLDLKGNDDASQIFDLIESCIYQVWDADQTYTRGQDFTNKEEVSQFFDQLEASHLEKIYDIVFEQAPKLVQTFTEKCPHCNHEKEYELEGITNFFG